MIRPSHPLLMAAVSAALLSAPAPAQQMNNAGIGTVKRKVDLQTPVLSTTGDNGLLGCAYLNGMTYVSGRGGPNTTSTKMIYVYDPTGTLVNSFPAPPAAQAAPWGVRDMDDDGVSLIGGSIIGIVVFDTAGNPVNQVVANNGPQAIVQPITGPALATLGNYRAVAYDPGGNAGNGSLFVSNNGAADPIIEIDLAGNVLNTFANLGWAAYGLARDSRTGMLWANGMTSNGPIIELDPQNGMAPTGNSFPAGVEDFHAGIDDIPGGDPGSYASDFDLVSVLQTNPDTLFYHRVHLYPGVLGYNEAFLEGDINGAGLTRGNMGTLAAGDTLRWRLNPGTSISNGSLGWVVLNFGDDARTDAVTNNPVLPGNPVFPELRAANLLSNPRSFFAAIAPLPVGAPAVSITMPPGIMNCFSVLRMQGIYLELAAVTPFPFLATNEIWANAFDESGCSIVVEANGPNSFNNNTASGFFRVLHMGGPAITEVTFDFASSPNPLVRADQLFDTDEVGMADIFNAGNSTLVGCMGTYRNASDVTTGLVYDNLNTPPNPCNTMPNANTGYIASNPGSGANNWKTLTFRFTNFSGGTPAAPVVFEFDADTDFGVGTDGAAQAGMVISVTLATGQTLVGELRVDPVVPMRSVTGF